MASNSPNSPRQKMINLMYLVFIAMMALNVSTEVLDGFELVEESLLRSVKASSQRNNNVFQDLENFHSSNPEKSQIWYDRAEEVKSESDELFDYIQSLKERIAKKGDGKEADPENLKHPDDLNAAYEVMFERGTEDAKKLKIDIDEYREFVLSMVQDTAKQHIIRSNLNTEASKKAKENKKTWEESMFEQMPMAAAITLLTKLQNDIRYAEGEVLADLLKNIDVDDFRVNSIEAFVIPQSNIVMRGGTYEANIGLFAQDSTQRPRIFVGGRELPESAHGRYTASAGSTGTFKLNGHIEMPRSDGSFLRRDFSSEYFVVEPSATIAPTMMNVLYAGIKNEIRIAVPGVASQHVSATISNGTLVHKGNDIWEATPRLGSDAVITVNARMNGSRTQEMAKGTFRVRQLPDPTLYLSVPDAQGNLVKFRGGGISKSALNNVSTLKAAIDDGILDIEFQVLRFQVVTFDQMKAALRDRAEGANFTPAQKAKMRDMSRGNSLFISGVVVKGPDGLERTLNTAFEITIR